MELAQYNEDLYFTKDGIIKVRHVEDYRVAVCSEFADHLKEVGFMNFQKDFWIHFVRVSVGKPEKVLFDEVQKRFKLALGMRGRREVDSFVDSFRIWRVNELIAFDGMVIGFDKQSFTRTDRDFSFSISLRSCPYKEQVQFVRENKNKLVAYAKAKVQEYYKFKRHIGNLAYYYLSDMVVTRDSQVQFVFSIRKEIEMILSEEDDKEAK